MQFGVDVPECAGMVTVGDAASIPDNAFWHLENMIPSGPGLVSRPGQQKINAGNSLGSVTIEGIYDTGDVGRKMSVATIPEEEITPGVNYSEHTAILLASSLVSNTGWERVGGSSDADAISHYPVGPTPDIFPWPPYPTIYWKTLLGGKVLTFNMQDLPGDADLVSSVAIRALIQSHDHDQMHINVGIDGLGWITDYGTEAWRWLNQAPIPVPFAPGGVPWTPALVNAIKVQVMSGDPIADFEVANGEPYKIAYVEIIVVYVTSP